MRKLNFIVSAVVAMGAVVSATAASAADLAARTYTKAPVIAAPIFNWTGFYVGGNLGYSWGRSANSETISAVATGLPLSVLNSTNDVNGVIGGGQVGYNWQVTNWLLGLEADIQGSGEKGSTAFICAACGNAGADITSVLNQKLTWFGTLRGRAGLLASPTVLLYATGGLAYGELKTDGSITGVPGNGVPVTVAFPGTSSTRAGWTAGVGVEGRIAGNWTAKLEYLYMDLGTVSAGPVPTTILGPLRTPVAASYSSHFTDNILRAGVNYHFNAGPVVAKY